MKKILVVDKDPLIHGAFKKLFKGLKYPMVFAYSVKQAKEILDKGIINKPIDTEGPEVGIVFIGYYLRGGTGLGLYDWIVDQIGGLRVIGMTCDGTDRIQEMKDHGFMIVIDKNKLDKVVIPIVQEYKQYLTGKYDRGLKG